ncbi:signal peptidase I [Desulfitobacterium dehalogenans ATCC 51507]|uniref:Signal peptidase I n=1 Tax=Desulfitobacterium dehalogenans (strain ATCC 51507 / DSM 9161 / JW/IU-DC1) TaxID=756499 RepID=I4A5C9_DESDJ|nr:signal peptidase I [Desulfitobacterium dehalogenans]AFL99163.1 signal peptidase I [Desulfitobacterium dehalogenans ATCC 51507]
MSSTKHTTRQQIEDMRKEIQAKKLKKSDLHNNKNLKVDRLGGRNDLLKALSRMLFGVIVVTLLFSLVSINMAKGRGEVPSIFGYYLFVIESGSMEPTLKVGTVILSHEPRNPERLEKNDIVTFQTLSGAIITHRIIEVLDEGAGSIGYLTKGDNPINVIDQEVLTPERVIGVFIARLPLS